MKTRFAKVLALALAVVLLGSTPVALAQQSYYYWWQVVDERDEPFTGQNVTCRVYRQNQHATALLHGAASLANYTASNDPLVSDTNGKLHFYASYNDPVDVTCSYVFGGTAIINGLRTTDHRIVISRQQSRKIARFSVNVAAAATNQSSGISLPSGAVVRDVIIQNLNPRGIGTYHISVGFAGNHAVAANVNALVSAQALNSPDEWLRPHLVASSGNANTIASGNHRGAALSRYHTRSCGATDGVCGGANGHGIDIYIETAYVVHLASGLDVTYAVDPGTAGAARAHVFILWDQFHVGVDRQGLTN